jgi:hypothetical protein
VSEFDDLQDWGLQESEEQYDDKITISGRDYPGIYSDLASSFSLLDGGPKESLTGYFILRKSAYPQNPTDRGQVKVNGIGRQMQNISDDRAAWKIEIHSNGK